MRWRQPVTAASVVERAQIVLIDFDGPICDLFINFPASHIADRLRAILTSKGATITQALGDTRDPFDILRATPAVLPEALKDIERELAIAEIEAARLATPTPHGFESAAACKGSGKSVGIVSNTALAAVELYLSQHHLTPWIDAVVARTTPDPKLLKPAPHLILEALRTLRGQPASSVLIGDQVTDIEAARAAGVASIAYANRPGKVDRFRAAGADAVITDMASTIPGTDLSR